MTTAPNFNFSYWGNINLSYSGGSYMGWNGYTYLSASYVGSPPTGAVENQYGRWRREFYKAFIQENAPTFDPFGASAISLAHQRCGIGSAPEPYFIWYPSSGGAYPKLVVGGSVYLP